MVFVSAKRWIKEKDKGEEQRKRNPKAREEGNW